MWRPPFPHGPSWAPDAQYKNSVLGSSAARPSVLFNYHRSPFCFNLPSTLLENSQTLALTHEQSAWPLTPCRQTQGQIPGTSSVLPFLVMGSHRCEQEQPQGESLLPAPMRYKASPLSQTCTSLPNTVWACGERSQLLPSQTSQQPWS